MKYQTFRDGNKIIVVSQYAGRRVKGYAKCNPADSFDYNKGEDLATLRCDEKIAEKRVKRAAQKLSEAQEAFNNAEQRLLDMTRYLSEAKAELVEAQFARKKLEEDFN